MADYEPRGATNGAGLSGVMDPLRAADTIYVLRSEHPQVQLTYASRFPQKVDKLKLRKVVKVFPIKITLKADYDTNTREFDYGCSAKVGCQLLLPLPPHQPGFTPLPPFLGMHNRTQS
jgi:hypothetical protein